MTLFEEGRYKITDFVKLMKVSDNAEMWAKYFAAGGEMPLWETMQAACRCLSVFKKL